MARVNLDRAPPQSPPSEPGVTVAGGDWSRGIRHIIWDFNGTLLDDVQLCVDIVAGMLRRRGLPGLSLERYREIFDFPIRRYYADLGFDVNETAFALLTREFIAEYEEGVTECALHAGAFELLRAAASRGISCSVLSAAKQSFVEDFVVKRGLRDHLTQVIGLDHYEADSKLERGLTWLAESAIDRDRALLIGDTLHDAEVARALGVRCALVSDGHHSPARLSAAGYPVFPSLAHLASQLARPDHEA